MDLLLLIRNRKLAEYRMLLAIVSNPHVEKPGKLWDMLQDEQRVSTYQEVSQSPEKDREMTEKGIQQIKLLMSNNPRMIVK